MSTGRPSWLRGGGGFLNGVDGIIKSYTFITEKSQKGDDWVKCQLVVTQDGATEDIKPYPLFVGSPDDFEIADNGKTLVLASGRGINSKEGFGLFLTTLVEAGFSRFVDAEDRVNCEPMEGARVRFEQRTNEAATKKRGKRQDKKTGREYDRQDLVVAKFYSAPSPSKPNGAAKVTDDDIAALAKETLLKVLAKKSPVTEQNLQLLGNQTIGVSHPQRVAVVGLMKTPAFLAELANSGVIAYNADNKTVALAG